MWNPLELIRRWRYGGQTGTDYWSAEFRMIARGFGPVLGLAILISFAAPFVFDAQTLMYLDRSMPFIILGGLVLNVVVMQANATKDANSLELVLPQVAHRFPDGSIVWFDLKIPREGIEEICQYPDGSRGVHVSFLDRYEWQDKKLGRIYVWQGAHWKIPASIPEVFKRLGSGQIFHGNIWVNHNSCEAISVYVKDFIETEEGIEPVCQILDCAYTYDQFLKGQNITTSKDVLWHMAFKRTQKAFGSAVKHTEVLEQRLTVAEKESPRDYKEAADSRLKSIRSRHASIMGTIEPLASRLFKLIFNWKTIMAIGIVLGLLWILGVIPH